MTDQDIHPSIKFAQDWLANHLSMIKDGGSWAMPRAMTIYTINRKDQILIRTVGKGDESTEHVARSIGWSIAASDGTILMSPTEVTVTE
jgi:hypothetical protein